MRAAVIYDSQYGNTAQIAQAIADGLKSAATDAMEVDLRKIGDVQPEQMSGLDMLIAGSPTHGFRPTPAIKNFLKAIPKNALRGVKVAAFDTRFTEDEINSHGLLSKMVEVFGYAAQPIAERLEKRGGERAAPPEGFYVAGTEGPLLEGELERAVEWGRALLAKRELKQSL